MANHDDLDFATHTAAAMLLKQSRSGTIIIWAIAAFFGALIIWSMIFHIDETVRGQGKAVPSRHVQVIQNLEGGILETLNVREGQMVRPGQVLMELDPTQASGSLAETEETYFSLIAKQQRLQAMATGDELKFDDSVTDQSYLRAVASERSVYNSATNTLVNQQQLIDIRIQQKKAETKAYMAQLSDLQDKVDTLQKQVAMNEKLAKTGVASKAEVLRFKGELASAKSEYDEVNVRLPTMQSEIKALENERDKNALQFRQKAGEELADVQAKLGVTGATRDRRSDVVNRTQIKSNTEGVVKKLYIDSLGGVIKPGMPIAEIVPIDDVIIIEAKIQPKDIGFVQQDMAARVRISAFNFAMYGGLDGTVESVSADSIVDEKGRSFYLVRIKVNGKLTGADGKELRVIPGMQATVDITVARRTAFVYLVNPLLKIFKQ